MKNNKMSFGQFCYTVIYYLLAPFLFFRLLWKGRSLPAYRQRIAERFGLAKRNRSPVDIWVHAVSLGEVIAISPLIEELLQKNKKIIVTTMTPTGGKRVAEQFGERVIHRYVPYEFPFALRRFFSEFKPQLGIIVETELWPNLIYYARQAHVQLLLFNARLSQRSCQGYAKIAWLIKPILNQFSGIYTQTENDALRFKLLGADAERVQVIGNIKFDLPIKQIDFKPFVTTKSHWGESRVIFIAASTHDDEEQQILSVFRNIQQNIPNLLLLIAPRHPERFKKVHSLATSMGFNVGLRSDMSSLNKSNEVVILDSLGELLGFYHISDYAFIGGSLVPVGGHNVLEPIAMNVPVLTGHHVHNFQAICHSLLLAGGLIQIHSVEALVEQLVALHQDGVKKDKLRDAASVVLQQNQGALLRYVSIVEGQHHSYFE